MTYSISRRKFIASSAAFGAVVAVPAKAEVVCRPFDNGTLCTAGIPSRRIAQVAEDSRQIMENWCWAACMQLLFRHHGFAVSQEHIVERVFGDLVDQPLPGATIAQAVTQLWIDPLGNQFRPRAEVLIDRNFGLQHPNAGGAAISDMIAEQPLIVGSEGHATLVTAISYTQQPYAPLTIRDVRVRDPWPFNPNSRSLSVSEFVNTDFLMRVRI